MSNEENQIAKGILFMGSMECQENMGQIRRGDIIIADLGQHETSIQSGIRPCVVMSNNMANKQDRKSTRLNSSH